jgi:pimeloyl-ACP methyl ester carboxylesterase
MKTLVTLAAFIFSSLAFGQNTFADFNRGKKLIELKTGICMRYIDTGKPYGTPVVLLHGYTDTSRSFQLLIQDLLRANPGIRIIAPDLRGHGETSMPKDEECKYAPEKCFTPQLFASDVLDLMDKLCIDKAHVVGHSMGSIIAQELALKHQERVASMVLVGTFVNGKDCETIHSFLIRDLIEEDWRCRLEEQSLFGWPTDAYSILPMNMGEKVKMYLRENWVTEPSAAGDYLQAIYEETIATPLGTWIGTIRALGDVDYTAALRNIQIPTLILWATQDAVTTYKDQVRVKTAFEAAAQENGTTVIYKTYGKVPLPESGIPGNELGHNFHWGASKTVADDIDAFITTGMPLNNRPYANPLNSKQVLVEQGSRVTQLK